MKKTQLRQLIKEEVQKTMKENLSIDEKAKIYWMQKLKRGEITTLPKNPKEAWLSQMTKDQMQKDKDQFRGKQGLEESEGEKYFVIRTGGSIGEREFKKEFDSKEEATDYAKRMNKQLSPGEKSYYKIKYSVKKGLNEYGEDEFDRSPQMYSKGKSARDGRTDFDGTGLVVVGRTTLDNNAIQDMLDETDYYGVWNGREGYWFFKEEEENFDALEIELEKEFAQRGISARFEAQF
jgi:hypothetical protein